MPEPNSAPLSPEEVAAAQRKLGQIVTNVESAIFGKRQAIELVLVALIARGHVLIEDVPGVGKTSLISAVAKSLQCGFQRIQFTPDLLPSDVTGFSIYNQKTGAFEFRPGAVMSNLVLADEINRASAKTQAALLEAMEEKQVTVDGHTYRLEEPFMVMATQNPLDSFGTYPLPEAQIDRFLLRLSMGYPSKAEELRVISQNRSAKAALAPVATKRDVILLRELADRVLVSRPVQEYIVDLVTATRDTPDTALGVSPRGSIALYSAAKVVALFQGRRFVIPDDVKLLAPSVLTHRLILSHDAKMDGKTQRDVVESVLARVPVPSGRA